MGKISGPLLDRIALQVTVQPVEVEAWSAKDGAQMGSAEMCERVVRARLIQSGRLASMDGIDCNARIPEGMFATFCAMDAAAEKQFVEAQKKHLVSARGRGHIVRVSRTIADLAGSERITSEHLTQAISFRVPGSTGSAL